MRLELSHFIESDLDDIADYIAQDNSAAPSPSFRTSAPSSTISTITRCATNSALTSATKRAWPPLGAMLSSFVLPARLSGLSVWHTAVAISRAFTAHRDQAKVRGGL